MKKELGQNLLNKNLQEHKTFSIYDSKGLFAKYVYDNELKRYQSDYGYLTIDGVIEIYKDEIDERYIVWKGE